jgi:hypothetical protein
MVEGESLKRRITRSALLAADHLFMMSKSIYSGLKKPETKDYDRIF